MSIFTDLVDFMDIYFSVQTQVSYCNCNYFLHEVFSSEATISNTVEVFQDGISTVFSAEAC